MRRARPWITALAAAGLLGWGASASAASLRGYTARLEALALLQSLNADLLSHDSATAVLQALCDGHHLAPGARVAARLTPGADQPLPEAGRRALGEGEVRYRRVRLVCGTRVLSEADNWYRPAALTPDMNRRLDQTDTPFGVVVRPLDFHRRTLTAEMLFHPLPPGWEIARRPGGAVAVPGQVLRHSAVLTTGAGAPFSYVVETYTAEVLDLTAARRTGPSRP